MQRGSEPAPCDIGLSSRYTLDEPRFRGGREHIQHIQHILSKEETTHETTAPDAQ